MLLAGVASLFGVLGFYAWINPEGTDVEHGVWYFAIAAAALIAARQARRGKRPRTHRSKYDSDR
jgi:hypothetical protein